MRIGNWAATVIDPEQRRIRFVMSADDPDVVEHLETGSIALTGAVIVSLIDQE